MVSLDQDNTTTSHLETHTRSTTSKTVRTPIQSHFIRILLLFGSPNQRLLLEDIYFAPPLLPPKSPRPVQAPKRPTLTRSDTPRSPNTTSPGTRSCPRSRAVPNSRCRCMRICSMLRNSSTSNNSSSLCPSSRRSMIKECRIGRTRRPRLKCRLRRMERPQRASNRWTRACCRRTRAGTSSWPRI
ncbi:hypothetical protein RSAG8_05518, partial [Rhizoctonia solani AG-8 WAC10335]